MIEISTSILSMKKGEEKETTIGLEKAKTDYFHIDVMDGKFVEKNTYERMLNNASYIKRISTFPLDVHLMVEDVHNAIDDFLAFEPNIITIHLEACKNRDEIMKEINYIKDNHCRVGVAIKPETPIEKVFDILPYIHMCLIMTVEPGKGGQTLISEMTKKIEQLKKYIEENHLDIDIEVDRRN